MLFVKNKSNVFYFRFYTALLVRSIYRYVFAYSCKMISTPDPLMSSLTQANKISLFSEQREILVFK
ncbi:hypothetical protein SAMN05661012_04520 [Chitinophaga sancti]|uniref:Uncharacterized protein n=1 Tax=Chitinophaga sancti TaxID=1004 RepID=A0A1K1S0F0_9BACT|nr:hypothetical protein SAMN05661012_04520 [Chitinophaga sancti]